MLVFGVHGEAGLARLAISTLLLIIYRAEKAAAN